MQKIQTYVVLSFTALAVTACDGTDGAESLLEVSDEPAGENCPEGGQRIEAGVDTNLNGELDDDNSTVAYVCDGESGADGENGTDGENGADGEDGTDGVDGTDGEDGEDGDDGLNSLIVIEDQLPGVECAGGGKRVRTGVDLDGNGELDDGNVQEAYLCAEGDVQFAVAGRWFETGDFGGELEWDEQTFVFGTSLIEFDNDGEYAISMGQHWDTGEDIYYRTHWTSDGEGGYYYCAWVYDAPTLDDARNLDSVPDANDLDDCGFGAWSHVIPTLEVEGDWDMETIRSDAWDDGNLERAVVEYDNTTNRGVLQNPSDAESGADLYSVVLWTEPSIAGFHYCVVDSDLATLEEAQQSTAGANPNDLDAGCNGGAWVAVGLPPA